MMEGTENYEDTGLRLWVQRASCLVRRTAPSPFSVSSQELFGRGAKGSMQTSQKSSAASASVSSRRVRRSPSLAPARTSFSPRA
jgi:hypothetical protein